MSMKPLTEDRELIAAVEFWVALQGDTRTHVSYHDRQYISDREYVVKRSFSEGLPFLALTLPMLASAIESAFQTGRFECPPSFEKRGEHLPRLFNQIIRRCFDEQSGDNLPDVDARDIRALRQLTRAFKKYEAELDKTVVAEQVRQLCDSDKYLYREETVCDKTEVLLGIARGIAVSVFGGITPATISGRPGPGACAKNSRHESRFQPSVRYGDIESFFSYKDTYYWNEYHFVDRLREYMSLPAKASGVSVLVPVPKTFGKGRFICKMPHEYMWHQQGVSDLMRKTFRKNPFTRYSLPLNDQGVNQKRAMKASLDGVDATIDMSEASNLISKYLVGNVFLDLPEWSSCLMALTPRWMRLPEKSPDGRKLLEPKMYAPMGSSLCFPVMSFVHFALICAIISHECNVPPAHVARKLTVYGDDIVLPSKWARHVFDILPMFGMKLNVSKSFVCGKFRESCGTDAFNGVNVTPVYVKKRELLQANDGRAMKAVIATEYALRSGGYESAARVLRKNLEKRFGDRLPDVIKGSNIVGWWHDDAQYINRRIEGAFSSKKTQGQKCRVRTFKVRPFASMVGCWERLIRYYSIGNAQHALAQRNPELDIVWDTVGTIEVSTLETEFVKELNARLGICR